ncbi:MAG: hypothetical protein GXX79_02355 [Actinomycetales bacterium]|nr:hypothetical protein [Actinomycetales bacterium]
MRAVERFHGIVELVEYRQLRLELADVGACLDITAETVRSVCERAERAAPSSGETVPEGRGGRYREQHRRVSRVATLCALASEHALQAQVCARAQDLEGMRAATDALRRTIKALLELLDEAEDAAEGPQE